MRPSFFSLYSWSREHPRSCAEHAMPEVPFPQPIRGSVAALLLPTPAFRGCGPQGGNGLYFGLSLSVVSWMVGITAGALLSRTEYFEKLSHLNFIPSRAVNRALGIEQFKWILKNSYFRFLNQSIRVEGRQADLASIRHHMTLAEINHLVGFLFVASAALYQSFHVSLVFGLSMTIPNAILNGHPSLLQQENKRRLDQLLNRAARRDGYSTEAPYVRMKSTSRLKGPSRPSAM